MTLCNLSEEESMHGRKCFECVYSEKCYNVNFCFGNNAGISIGVKKGEYMYSVKKKALTCLAYTDRMILIFQGSKLGKY